MTGIAVNEEPTSWRLHANFTVACFALCLLPLMAHAGGLGIAPLVLITCLVALVTSPPKAVLSIPIWTWTLFAFLLWAACTSFWSPYNDKQAFTNPAKIIVFIPLFLCTLLAFKRAATKNPRILRHLLIAISLLSMCFLCIDILSGYGLTFLLDPLNPGEDALRKSGDAEMNLGHAITVLVLLMPVTVMTLQSELRGGWFLSYLFIAGVIITAILGQLMIAVLAVLAAVVFMVMANFRPTLAIRAAKWIAVFSILFAPLLGYIMGFFTPEMKASLPFSWEHRVEMWAHANTKILEAPLWGHGFDAVRTFDATFSSRGVQDWAVISLHPHNAGLHIWAETGLIGASLASLTILVIGMKIENFSSDSKPRAIAAAGLIMAVTAISNVTYGIWQEWWWASIILVCSLMWLIPDDAKQAEVTNS